MPKQERSLQLPAPRPGADRRGRAAVLIQGGGVQERSEPPVRDQEPPVCRPDSINMELENIVANTVLLKAREGEDGDGGADSVGPP